MFSARSLNKKGSILNLQGLARTATRRFYYFSDHIALAQVLWLSRAWLMADVLPSQSVIEL
jgi:hypothetical protein